MPGRWSQIPVDRPVIVSLAAVAGPSRHTAGRQAAARHPPTERPAAGAACRRSRPLQPLSLSSFRNSATAAPTPMRGCCANASASAASCARSATCCRSSSTTCSVAASTALKSSPLIRLPPGRQSKAITPSGTRRPATAGRARWICAGSRPADPQAHSARIVAPVGYELPRGTEADGMNREGRARTSAAGKQAGPRQEQVAHLVSPPEAVTH